MDPGKKVSFGFNKSNKKIFTKIKPVAKKVDLIECVEERSIKVKDAPVVADEPLIIPIKNNRLGLVDRIRDARTKHRESATETLREDNRPDSELTIEELAARELINEAKIRLSNNEPTKAHFVLPYQEGKSTSDDEREPTLDDYEKVPVNDYGMAMLRGMGWLEGMGIGKNPHNVETKTITVPELRPKGLGLGASRILKSEIPANPACDKDGNTLILKKGAYAKIVAGSHKGSYCEVQGLDDEAGRVIVRTSLKGEILTINECLIIPVTKEEYLNFSKVLNNVKYEEYKNKSNDDVKNYHNTKSENNEQEKRRDYRSYETKLDSSEKRSNHNKERYETKSKSSYKNKNRARSDDSDSERERNNRKKRKHKSKGKELKGKHISKSSYYQAKSSSKGKSSSRYGRSSSSDSDRGYRRNKS